MPLLLLHTCPGQLSHSFLGLDQLPICILSMLWNISKDSFGKTFCQHHFLSDIILLCPTTISSCLSIASPHQAFWLQVWSLLSGSCANIPTVSETPCEFQSNISPHVITSGFFAVPPFVLISSLFEDPFLKQVTWKELDVLWIHLETPLQEQKGWHDVTATTLMHVCMHVCSVMSNSLWFYGL